MVFSSLINWLAIALLIAVHWLLPSRRRLAWLAFASLALLAFNDFLAALLVLYLIALCAWAPRAVHPGSGLPDNVRRLRLWLIIVALLVPLVVLKYQGLLGIDALQRSGLLPLSFASLAVPIGISYLTFKALSYVIEVARGRLAPAGVVPLAAYLAFAPTVNAGPIDQPQRLLSQLASPARLDLQRLLYAGYRIGTGLVFKYAFADTLSEISDRFSASMLAVSPLRQLLFGPWFGLRLYFDFAGYSHIAIGVAWLLGIGCMENFAAPLLRSNISGFWRSWHISLTTFLRNYIFLSCAYRWARALGAQRAAYAATVLTFIVCGLWHGDGLNFVVWGLYHGLLLSLHQAFLHNTRKLRLFYVLRRQRWLAVPAWALTFVLVSIGWFPFAFKLPELVQIFGGGTP